MSTILLVAFFFFKCQIKILTDNGVQNVKKLSLRVNVNKFYIIN